MVQNIILFIIYRIFRADTIKLCKLHSIKIGFLLIPKFLLHQIIRLLQLVLLNYLN